MTARAKLRGLARAYRRMPWLIGDALNEAVYRDEGRAHGTFARDSGLSEYQLYDMARVASHWPKKDRVFDVPWSYYRDCGSDLGVAKAVLTSTVKMGWSREDMRRCLRRIREMELG